jgi:predicted DNA-binding transcriptional regulator AlpA
MSIAISITAAAKLAGISRAFLYAEIKHGRGPKIIKLGRRTLVLVKTLEEWLRSREHGAL